MAYITLLLCLFPIIFLAWRLLGSAAGPPLHFPPGPPALPFLGNLHQIPLRKPFVQFAAWGRAYGRAGLLGLRLGPRQRVLVLTSWAAARDLLDQRGAVYSSRPRVPIVEYVVPPPGELHLVFMPYGAAWRRARRTVVAFLQDDRVDRLLPLQHAEAAQMLAELLARPAAYHEHVLRAFGAVVLTSVFGARGRDFAEGGRLRQFFACQDEWAGMLDAGAVPPLDLFPWLRHVPDSLTPWRGWKARAAALKKRQNGLYHGLLEEARARIAQGKGLDSFMAELLRDQEKSGYSNIQLEYLGGFLMEGGSDTTAMAFEVFILAMAAHPEARKRAQDEVDRVFGDEGVGAVLVRDMDLPYLKACFNETLRWRPGFPLAIPHCTTEDDVYRGYQIPRDTTVLMNIWAIQHDPDEYEEPDAFRPERFLHHPLGLKTSGVPTMATSEEAGRKPVYGFGGGRRVCAGQRMAENSMLLAMAKLLWSFDMVGPAGLDTSVGTAFKDAILTGPKLFPVDFRVRGSARRDKILTDWAKADEYLKAYE